MSSSQQESPIGELLNLKGKRAIVTGGAMGIGLAIASRLAEAGAAVLIADANAKEAGKAADKLKKCGYQAHFATCDVSSEEEVKDMAVAAVKEMGGIDILVNNAGVYPRMPLEQMTGEDFAKVIAVNLTGTFLCSRHVSQKMMEQKKGGCIINIASIEALHPSSTGMTAYDASKGGVLTLTKSLARELGPNDIRVNAIAPGAVLTRGVYSQTGETSEELKRAQLKELKSFMARMALGRMGEADEIARVALFLASDLSSYMTGSLVVVDGGYLIS